MATAWGKAQTQRVTLEREEWQAVYCLLQGKRETRGLSAYEAIAQSAILAAIERASGR